MKFTYPKIIFVLLVGLLGVALFFYHSDQSKKNNLISIPYNVQDKDYTKVRDYLLSVVEKKDPRTALLLLNQLIRTNPKASLSCHLLAHEIGHKAYEKYKDFKKSIEYSLPVCNSGYFHGVVEDAFINQPDINVALKTLCSGVSENRCYHGIGHALMVY